MTSLAAIGEDGVMLGATIVVAIAILSMAIVRHGHPTEPPAVTTAGGTMGCLQKPPMRTERKEDDSGAFETGETSDDERKDLTWKMQAAAALLQQHQEPSTVPQTRRLATGPIADVRI